MSDKDELRAEYERGYTDGFDCGAEAMAQQVEGYIDGWDAIEKIRKMLDAFWKERES